MNNIQTARNHSEVTFRTLNHFLPYLSASMPNGIARKRPRRRLSVQKVKKLLMRSESLVDYDYCVLEVSHGLVCVQSLVRGETGRLASSRVECFICW